MLPRKPPPIETTAQRLDKMEKRWKEANDRQKERINRLIAGREAALKLLSEAPAHSINPKLMREITEALS